MKIHFKGYDEKYDEWRNLNSDDTENFPVVHFHRVLNGNGGSWAERFFLFLEMLRLEIKRNFKSGRKDDPNVCITLEIQADAFNMLVEKQSWKKVKEKGRISYVLDPNVSLTIYLENAGQVEWVMCKVILTMYVTRLHEFGWRRGSRFLILKF